MQSAWTFSGFEHGTVYAIQDGFFAPNLQWGFFTEVGRVVPSWNFNTLNKNQKFDLGVGVRGMVKGLVDRIDLAGSSESCGVNMIVSQPFQWECFPSPMRAIPSIGL